MWMTRRGHIGISGMLVIFCFFFFFFFNKFIYLFFGVLGLCYCAWAFSSCGEQGLLSLWCAGFSLQWLLLLRSMDSRRAGFSSCGTWAQ